MINVFLESEKTNENWIKEEDNSLILTNTYECEKERKKKDEIIKQVQCNGKIMADNVISLKKELIDKSSTTDVTVS